MHEFECRVYYEDTDLAGIVYYANYLKFTERARTEALNSLGIDQTELKAREGIVFAVRRVEVDYLKPAVFQDWLRVATRVESIGGASVDLSQDIWRGDAALVRTRARIVCLGADGRPKRVPQDIRAALGALAD